MFPTSDRFNFHKKNQSFKNICNYKTEHRRCHVARRTIQEPSYPREIYSYANDRFSQRKFEIDPFPPPLSESLQFEHTHIRRSKCNHCTPSRTQKKKTRIQDTRLSQLSLISFRYQQNLRSIFRHSWQLSIITRIFLFFLVNRWCTNDIKLVKHIRLSQSENRQNCTKRKRARDWTGRGEVLVNEKLNRVSSIARFYGRLFYPNRWIRQLRVGKRKKNTKKRIEVRTRIDTNCTVRSIDIYWRVLIVPRSPP